MTLPGDGRRLLTAGLTAWRTDRSLFRERDTVTGKTLRSEEESEGAVAQLALAPDGRTLAVVRADGPVLLRDVASGQELRRLDNEGGPGTNVCFSADGKTLLGAGAFGAFLWEDAPTEEVVRVRVTNRTVKQAALAPDGRLVAVIDEDGGLRLWCAVTRGDVALLERYAHPREPTGLAFLPDGRTLVTGSEDGTALVRAIPGVWREPGEAPPDARELLRLWEALASPRAGDAFRALGRLAAFPAASVPFLTRQVRPAKGEDVEDLRRLLADLDSPRFRAREEAEKELAGRGLSAVVALGHVLREGKPTLEVRRRAEALVKRLTTPRLSVLEQRIRCVIRVLEKAGTADARGLLEGLGGGAPEALLTGEAKAALRRMAFIAPKARPE
jgi:hypothetical protein